MRKFALFAFNGDPMCFVHVLLNALDIKEKGHEVALVVEGSATKLVKLLSGGPGLEDFAEKNPQMHKMIADLFQQVKDDEMISCVCRACSTMMGSLEDARELALPLCSELKGHPSMTRYVEEGYEIISF
ncbi:MAG: DsrE family protein [Spirochaetaceae bacterium]